MNIIEKLSPVGGSLKNSPKRLIIHAMGENISIDKNASLFYKEKGKNIEIGEYHADVWLQMVGTSAHYLIEPNGYILKLRKTNQRAYHAFKHNTDTIGIEVLTEGSYNYDSFKREIRKDWVTKDQYTALIEISKEIIEYWDIPIENVFRHSDLSPDRKQDPGTGFKWEWFIEQLKK